MEVPDQLFLQVFLQVFRFLVCLVQNLHLDRQPKVEDKQLNYFLQKDKIASFGDFNAEKELRKTYKDIAISRTVDKFICIFMLSDFTESYMTVVVHNKSTLCSPLTMAVFKNGSSVPLGKILNPNNGLSSYSQFIEAVRLAFNYRLPVDVVLKKVTATLLETQDLLNDDPSKRKTKIAVSDKAAGTHM